MCALRRKRLAALVMAFVMMALLTPQQVKASNYFDENRIFVKTLVIVIDTLGVGEDNIRIEFERLRQTYDDSGETFVMDDGDWLYLTQVPHGFASPLNPDNPIEDFYTFIRDFIPTISSGFNWQRIFIYEDNFSLEPKTFGRHGNNRTMLPDEISLVERRNLFDVNFTVNGLNVGKQVGLHGEIHWMECMMNCIDYETAISQVYQKYGSCHAVLESYLDSIGVATDGIYRIDSERWHDAGLRAYFYHILTPEQQDVYNAYLLQKMREEFDLLPYLWRFFNYSPEQAAD